MALNLNVYDIIKGPVVSTKAQELNKELNKLVLYVHPQANKMQIKDALQRVFNVKVEKVNTLRRKGKARRVRGRRTMTVGQTEKRVYVTLKEGYSVNLFDKTTQPKAQ